MFQRAKAFSAAPWVPVIVQRQNTLSSKQPHWGNISFFFLSKQETVSQSHAGGILETESWRDLSREGGTEVHGEVNTCSFSENATRAFLYLKLLREDFKGFPLEFPWHVQRCMLVWPSCQIRRSVTGCNHNLHDDMALYRARMKAGILHCSDNNSEIIHFQCVFDDITFDLCRKWPHVGWITHFINTFSWYKGRKVDGVKGSLHQLGHQLVVTPAPLWCCKWCCKLHQAAIHGRGHCSYSKCRGSAITPWFSHVTQGVVSQAGCEKASAHYDDNILRIKQL